VGIVCAHQRLEFHEIEVVLLNLLVPMHPERIRIEHVGPRADEIEIRVERIALANLAEELTRLGGVLFDASHSLPVASIWFRNFHLSFCG
jgi:hypothetical protein